MDYRKFICLLCLIFIGGCQDDLPTLWGSKDSELQKRFTTELNTEFQDDFWQNVDRKKIGIALIDISDIKHPRVAEINGDVMMYAASLPKIAILLGAFVEIERGHLTFDNELQGMMTRMIRNSSNQDASLVLTRVGIQNLADILRSERFRLYDPERNGGLWVGKKYNADQYWQKDPLHSITHGATAMQVVRYYYLAYTGQLVSAEYKKRFWEILSNSAINSKFVKGVKKYHPEAAIFRKSGTWRNFHADSAVVVGKDYRYIVAALTEHPQGAQILVRLIGAVEKTMQEFHVASEDKITEKFALIKGYQSP